MQRNKMQVKRTCLGRPVCVTRVHAISSGVCVLACAYWGC